MRPDLEQVARTAHVFRTRSRLEIVELVSAAKDTHLGDVVRRSKQELSACHAHLAALAWAGLVRKTGDRRHSQIVRYHWTGDGLGDLTRYLQRIQGSSVGRLPQLAVVCQQANALRNERRLRILDHLRTGDGVPVHELAHREGVSQGTVSSHLTEYLYPAELVVRSRPESNPQSVHYRIADGDDRATDLLDYLGGITA